MVIWDKRWAEVTKKLLLHYYCIEVLKNTIRICLLYFPRISCTLSKPSNRKCRRCTFEYFWCKKNHCHYKSNFRNLSDIAMFRCCSWPARPLLCSCFEHDSCNNIGPVLYLLSADLVCFLPTFTVWRPTEQQTSEPLVPHVVRLDLYAFSVLKPAHTPAAVSEFLLESQIR